LIKKPETFTERRGDAEFITFAAPAAQQKNKMVFSASPRLCGSIF